VRGVADAADHRPGRAWRFVDAAPAEAAKAAPPAHRRGVRTPPQDARAIAGPASDPQAPPSLACGSTDEPDLPRRPFWLLKRPIVLRDPSVRILAGPERIESGWWDARDQRRDYYVVQTSRGQRAWVFVEAGTPPPRGPGTGLAPWTLHGWFA
jgi:protein ImuB